MMGPTMMRLIFSLMDADTEWKTDVGRVSGGSRAHLQGHRYGQSNIEILNATTCAAAICTMAGALLGELATSLPGQRYYAALVRNIPEKRA